MSIERIQRASPLKTAQQGVVLIEAMIAILIFSVGVLGIVGMQASMIKNTSDSKYRADAAYIAQQYIGQVWSSVVALPPILPPAPVISNILPNGTLTPSVSNVTPSAFELTVTVNWQQPGEAGLHNFTTTATIAP